MTALVRAELLKLRTTRTIYALLAATVGLTVLGVCITILTAGDAEGTFPLDTPEGIRNVLAAGWPVSTFVMILGILSVANEFRHGSVTPTFLVTPHRSRVIAAKMIALTLVGLVFAGIAALVTLVVALPWLAAKDLGVSLFDADVIRVPFSIMLGTTLYGLLGVGLGALIRNQVAAVTIALVWSFVLEGILVSFLPEVGKWLPGGAGTALSGGATPEGDLLPVWGAALILALYAVAMAGIGSRFVVRRDVT
ncbi:MAG: ABC transporter permease [Actinobacteria bacterium]|nr:ABC transporter permease [Actinomycetota bacterium]